jgi:hypothetical protein
VTGRGISYRVFAVAFLLNVGWEMAQMSAYVNVSALSLRSLAECSVAALGDALYVLALYWIGRLLTRQPLWAVRLTARRMITILICGLGFGLVIEYIGLLLGFWQYRKNMPTLSFGVGLWPVLQSMILPLVTFRIISHLCRGQTRAEHSRGQ